MAYNSNLKDELANKYVIFLCEGTNEEQALKFMVKEHLLCIEDGTYRIDLARKGRGKKSLSKNIEPALQYNYGKPVALVYILDSLKEKVKLSRSIIKPPDIYYILTPPEFEILYIIKNNWYKEYSKDKVMPSKFCAGKNTKLNFKNEEAFAYHFSNHKEFINTCLTYKTRYQKINKYGENQYYLYDLIKA